MATENIDQLIAEMMTAPVGVGRGGGRRGKQTDPMTAIGGKSAALELLKTPKIVTPKVGEEYFLTKALFDQVNNKGTEVVKNFGCWTWTGDLAVRREGVEVGVKTLGLTAAELKSEVADGVIEKTGKIEITRLAYACGLPLAIKVTPYNEFWPLQDLLKWSIPRSALVSALESVYGVVAAAESAAEEIQ